jgi:uncharacterized protein involved in outer membrane biogenesis
MSASLIIRRSVIWAVTALVAMVVVTAGLAAAVGAGYGRALLVHYVAGRVGRPLQINGTLHAHLFARNPLLIAEGVIIDNPPWMPAGRAAEIGRLSLVLRLPGFGHRGGIIEFEAQAATLELANDRSRQRART